jgi:hypothetical protein
MIENGGGASAVALAGVLADSAATPTMSAAASAARDRVVGNRINISCGSKFSGNAR